MFSSLRNHTNNLIHSQRFYYNSYEYYNDFQDIEVDAKNDLGKIFFYLKRKSKGKIFSYRKQVPEEYFPRKIKGNQFNTMEDIIYPFLEILFENNYSDLKPDLDKFKQTLEMHYLPAYSDQYISMTEDQEWHDYSEKIQSQVRQIKLEIADDLGVMEDQDKINQANIWFCLEAFTLYIVKEFIQNQDSQNKTSLYYSLLAKYRQFISNMIENMLESHSWNILYLAIPNLGNLPKIIHPITLGLQAFTEQYNKKQQQIKKPKPHLLKQPKIVFLNLDGKQHYQNIKEIKRLNCPIFYISIYKEPNQGDLNNISLHQQDDNENFKKISQVLSNKMIQQLDPTKEFSHAGSKMLLFPLNSIKLLKQFRKKKSNLPQSQTNIFPKLGTSEDIHFLFQIMIYEEIRSFNPTIILVSYNGSLDIKQDQFSEMIRNLTIMSDHKILLFPNLSELFQVPQEILPVSEDDDDAFDKFALYKQFYNKYMNYQFEQVSCASEQKGQNRPNIINTQRFLHNLSMFIKLSSGTYSMKPRTIQTPSSKYLMASRYMYLQQLSSFPGFQCIKKYISNKWDCQQLEILFKEYGKAELKENKKENEFYEGLIENVFNQLFNNCQNIPKEALYRVEELKCQIESQHEVDRKSAQFMNLLKMNLIQAKEKLLLENLQAQKHRKVYKPDRESENNQVRCYTFCMFGDETGQQLQFDKYTQIIVDSPFSMIAIINYKMDKEHQILVSNDINTAGQLITVSVVKATQSIKDQYNKTKMQLDQHTLRDSNKLVRQNFIYVNYSYCYINRVLYLYWPQKWCLEDQIMYKLLNMPYKPQIDKRIIRVYLQNGPNNQSSYIYEQVPFQFEQQSGTVVPRFGCSSYAFTSDQFYIFGGIYDSKYDFLESCCCINRVKIVDGKLFFKNISKIECSSVRLKPKINYTIEAEKGNYIQTAITNVTISGGYGRQTTNFYNIFSYDSYNFSFESKMLTIRPDKGMQKQQLKVRCKQRRVANMNEPIQINQRGKFPVSNDQNFLLCDRNVKFIHKPMDKFIFELETRKINNSSDQEQKQYNFASFLEDNYRFNEMKTDLKKLFLFGFNNFIREAIFSKFWSPQLYVLQNLKPFIMQISLKTDKNANSQKISIPPFLMPIQQDMVSMCLEQDNLYLLASSPASAILSQLSKHRHKLVLYKGRIQNLRKHDIQMEPKLAFQIQKYESLKAKTIFAIDKSIKVVGGFQQASNDNVHRRNDYILDETDKQKFKTRLRKVQSLDVDLNRPYPVIVKSQETYLIYSVIQSTTFNEEIDKQQEEIYKLIIQSFTIDEACKQEYVVSSQLKFYMAVPVQGFKKCRINPCLKQPKLVRISKYKRFSMNNFKDMINKVAIKANKKLFEYNSQIEKLQALKNSKPEQSMQSQNRNKTEQIQKKKQKIKFFQSFQQFLDKYFKKDLDKTMLQYIQLDLLQNFKRKMHQLVIISQKEQPEKSYENQEFLKQLKNCYTVIHKQLLQTILQLGPRKPNQHIFIIQDKGSQKTKYLAIGPLGTTNLSFFKIFFKHELMLCLNEAQDQCFFYHPTALGCEQIIMDINRYKKEKIIEDTQKQEETMKISVKI